MAPDAPDRLLTSYPSLDAYRAAGGGTALDRLGRRGKEWAVDEVDRAGLRGRGGAGFPTGRKWRSVAGAGPELGDRYVVANGAEGEPGTYKDRPLLRMNPYQVLEGLAVAASVVDAREAFIALKRSFTAEIAAVTRAVQEMTDAGLFPVPVTIVAGPEEYLFGEETGLLEVIEGNDPLPRWLPPYQHGLFATTPQEGWQAGGGPPAGAGPATPNPTLMNNVETLAHVSLILRRGADQYRTLGPPDTPGPLLCTVVGDVERPAFAEVTAGLTLRELIETVGGGVREGRNVKTVLAGVSNPALGADALDAVVSYDGMKAAGSGLGSAGFVVYDDRRSALSIARMVSRFLYVESCGQCRACKFGCGEITRRLDKIANGEGEEIDVAVIGERLRDVTDQTRCFLAAEEQQCISSLLRQFPEDFAAALEGAADHDDNLPVPKILDLRDGHAAYDDRQARKQPDWTYVAAS